MSLQADIQSTLGQTTRHLQGAEQRTEARLRAINVRGARELLRIARSVVHVQSGRLQSGMIVEGPFDIGTGTLEARISAPSVPYGAAEVARGGDHDYIGRTLDEGQSVLDQIADDMERAIVEEIAR